MSHFDRSRTRWAGGRLTDETSSTHSATLPPTQRSVNAQMAVNKGSVRDVVVLEVCFGSSKRATGFVDIVDWRRE